jgi:hypothetical protein
MKAFPCISLINKKEELGMDLRDYFAAQALQGLLNEANSDFTDDAIAELAYSLADAMMKARGK